MGWNELAVGLNASLLTPERTAMQRIEAIWGAGNRLRNTAREIDWDSSSFSVENGGRQRRHPAFREADSSAVEDSARVVCCLARETSRRRQDFRSVSQREVEAARQCNKARIPKGIGRGSEKLLPSLPTPLPSLLSLCCASDCPFFLPRQIPTASSSCSFCIMSSFRSQASRYPPPPPPSPQLCKQTAPHSDLAPASLGRAPPDHRRRPSRRAIQRLLPLGHHQQCQDSGLVQLG